MRDHDGSGRVGRLRADGRDGLVVTRRDLDLDLDRLQRRRLPETLPEAARAAHRGPHCRQHCSHDRDLYCGVVVVVVVVW